MEPKVTTLTDLTERGTSLVVRLGDGDSVLLDIERYTGEVSTTRVDREALLYALGATDKGLSTDEMIDWKERSSKVRAEAAKTAANILRGNLVDHGDEVVKLADWILDEDENA